MHYRKAISCILSLVFAVGLSFLVDAQTLDQAAPSAVTQPSSTNTLAVPAFATITPAATSVAPAAQTGSAIESMFAGMAAGLGTPVQDLSQFGYSLFEKPTAPSLASIGDDYVLGPGDSLVLYLWGDPVDIKELSSSYTLPVDRNGFLFLAPAGQISVWGQDLGTVRNIIKSMLDRRYKKFEMSLTLATLRQFPVFVSGYAGNPGTVLATGADTIFTILSRAGGIKKTGSLRKVLLTRQGKEAPVKIELDFYDSLVKGLSVDLRVREGDSLFVPGIGPVTALAGELKRPGIYELKGDTSIAAALELAGGALPSARSGGITLLRFSESGKNLVTGDLANASFSSKPASDGDFVFFGKVTELLVGQTQVAGPVKYAGRYEIASYKTLGTLLSKAQIVAEANLFYGRVYRMDPSGRDKSFAFSPRDVLAGADIPLAEFDRVVLYRYDDVGLDPDFDRFPATLVVSGPVKYPGFYLYKEGATLAGLLADNALTLDANPWYGEIVRRTASGREEYFTFSPSEILSRVKDIPLSKLDRVNFVKRGADAVAHDFNKFPDAATLAGQVAKPEVYALGAGLKLSKLLTKDQILLDTNLNYAEITRLKSDGKNEYVTFRPSEILDGSWDFELGSRDVVKLLKVGYAPEKPDFDRFFAAVQVTGPIQFGGLYAWREGMVLSALLAKAKPALETNQVYAEIIRPLGGNKFEFLTFAPREIASGSFDLALKARDAVKLYTTVKAAVAKLGAETPAEPAAPPVAAVPAPVNPAVVGTPTAVSATSAVVPATPVNPATPDILSNSQPTDAPADLGRFLEVVTISGSVRYSGPYARTPTLKLSSVITPDQMLEETNLDYAELTRLKADGGYEYTTFAPREVLEGKFDLALRARDSIRLVKKTEFGGALLVANIEKFADLVQLTGRVARPEVFAYRPGMKLSQILTKDQILLDTNLNYAEITRLKSDGKNEYLTFRPAEVLTGTWDIDLGPRDVVRLVKVGYSPDRPDFDRFVDVVQVVGPVQFAGLYAWKSGMKLSALLSLAQPALETNKYYAEVVRPRGGGRYEYLTFAPREVADGSFDMGLLARDAVRLYTTAPAATIKLAAEVPAEAATPSTPAVSPSAPAIAGEASSALTPASTPAATAPVPALASTVPASDTVAFSDATPSDLGRFLEVVNVAGSVRYTGPYARTPTLKLSSVITADQVLEETNLDYAELTRLKEDGSFEYLTFLPRDILEGRFDLALRAKDSIRLVKKTAFGGALAIANIEKFADVVQLVGQAARPEVFALRPGMKLSALLIKDQILLDTNLNYAEILRLKTDGKNEYRTFRPAEVLAGTWDLEMGARDIVKLVKVGYSPAKPDLDRFSDTVQLAGPVEFPGLYAWRSGMKLSILLALARPALEVNQVYAEIVRPLSGGRFEYVTFAPREVTSGVFDFELKARDGIKLYTTAPATGTKQGTEIAAPVETPANLPAPVAAASVPAVTPAPAAPAESGNSIVTPAAPATSPAPTAVAPALSPGLGAINFADLSRFLEVVTISGSVRYSGPYARTPTLKLSSVVTADQIIEETNLDYAELTRLKEDGSSEYLTFLPRDVLEGRFDITLRAKDSIRLLKKTVFGGALAVANIEKFADVVQLVGQAARPEVFALRSGMKLSQVLTKDQILLDTNLNYAEILSLKVDGKNEYRTFRPAEVLAGTWDIDLGPRDAIRLVKVGYAPEKPDFDRFVDVVQVAGPVQFAGMYAWREGMKLSELQTTAAIVLETNQVYADITRPLLGGKSQVLTFAPREIASGSFDIDLAARDVVRFYSVYATKAEIEAFVETAPTTPVAGTPSTPGSSGNAGAPVVPGTTAAPSVAVAPDAAQAPVGAKALGYSMTPGPSSSISTDTGFYLEVVTVSGVVRYEGPYARTPTLKLSSVVTADQILQDTSLDYAELTRRRADGSWEYSTFSPREVLANKVDMPLRAQDSIRFVKVGYMPEKPDFDHFGNAYAVVGSARLTGLYSISKPKMLSDVITGEQMLSNTDVYYAEIERWVTGGRTEYKTFSPMAVLDGTQDERIFPHDIIRLVPAGDKGKTHDFSRFPDTVLVKGNVRYPGRYAWHKGMQLADILAPEDLLIDTDSGYAEVRRHSAADETILIFSPSLITQGKKDLELSARDEVIFYPKYFNVPVTVSGEVAESKVIPYYDGMELSAILRSVSLNGDFGSLKAVVTKVVGGSVEVYLEDYFRKQSSQKVLLTPGDSISIKRLLPDEHLPVIIVRGAVKTPQSLEFTDGMRLSEALTAAGGFDPRAYPYGLILIRKAAAEAQQKQVDRLIAQLEAASAAGAALPSSTDSSLSSAAAVIANLQIDLAVQRSKLGGLKQLYKEGFGRISLEVPDSIEALAASSSNVVLERDDMIFVPTRPTYVLVSGEVADQNVVAYRDGMTVKQAIAESGWLSKEADLPNAYIIRASGRLDSTEGKGFLFFRPNILNYPLNPGDTVVVPTKSVKVSIGWSYIKDSLTVVTSILTGALTAKTLLGL